MGDVWFPLPAGCPTRGTQLLSLLGQAECLFLKVHLSNKYILCKKMAKNTPTCLSPCVGERWQLDVLGIGSMRVSGELISVGWCLWWHQAQAKSVKYKEAVSGSGDCWGKNCEGLGTIWWVIPTCWLCLSTLTSTGPHFLKCWRQDIGLQKHSVCPNIAILTFSYLK